MEGGERGQGERWGRQCLELRGGTVGRTRGSFGEDQGFSGALRSDAGLEGWRVF